MIKKLFFISVFTLFALEGVHAQIDPRVKAFGTMALYGTAGGALLGTATLAFGSSSRSIAKGASIGLYAGILFGSYIVISHAYRQHRLRNPRRPDKDYYPDDVESPYEEGGGGGLFDAALMDTDKKGRRWHAAIELARYSADQDRPNDFLNSRDRNDIELMVPIVHMSF